MFRAAARNPRRKPSQEPKPVGQLQQKKPNQIKNKMQSKNLPARDNLRSTKFANHTNLPQPGLLLAKECLNHSEEDTKVSEQEESFALEGKVGKASAGEGRGNAELEVYLSEISSYVLQRQEQHKIDEGYLRHHRVLTVKLRSYLVRYIFRISQRFGLLRTTIFLAVHYMDLFFSKVFAFKDQFETVVAAQASLFIAMKYEEIYPPELGDWIDNRQKPEVVRMEALILQALDFNLAHYTLEHFVHMRLWEEAKEGEPKQPSQKMLLLMDLSLFDLRLRLFHPESLARCFLLMGQMNSGPLSAEQQVSVEELEPKMVEHVGWMVETYQDALKWLVDSAYQGINHLE